ncbi:hypothetical protein B0H21DRAFT_839432, partial [Amylocystis lapponica]
VGQSPSPHRDGDAIIEAGKDLFIEWPAGRNLQETVALAEAAKRKGIRTMVGLQSRQSPALNKLKEIVESGVIGRVYSTTMWCDYAIEGSEYMADATNGAGVLGIPSGIRSTVHAREWRGSWVSLSRGLEAMGGKAGKPLVWTIDGEKGTVLLEGDPESKVCGYINEDEPTLYLNGEKVVIAPDGKTNTGRAWAEFAKGPGGKYPTLDDAVQAKKIVDAVARSAEEGKRIAILVMPVPREPIFCKFDSAPYSMKIRYARCHLMINVGAKTGHISRGKNNGPPEDRGPTPSRVNMVEKPGVDTAIEWITSDIFMADGHTPSIVVVRLLRERFSRRSSVA